MVVQNTVRTYGVIQVFRFVEGIRLQPESRQIHFLFEKTISTSYVRNMFWATIIYKYHAYPPHQERCRDSYSDYEYQLHSEVSDLAKIIHYLPQSVVK